MQLDLMKLLEFSYKHFKTPLQFRLFMHICKHGNTPKKGLQADWGIPRATYIHCVTAMTEQGIPARGRKGMGLIEYKDPNTVRSSIQLSEKGLTLYKEMMETCRMEEG